MRYFDCGFCINSFSRIDYSFDYNSIDDSDIFNSNHYLGYLNSKYESYTITRPSNEPCNIICNNYNSCCNRTINCPLNNECIIHCTILHACTNVKMKSKSSTIVKLITNVNCGSSNSLSEIEDINANQYSTFDYSDSIAAYRTQSHCR